VIDTDPGVDDAIALLMAFSCPQIDVVGLTTTAGNVPIGPATRNALAILEAVDRTDIQVARGAARPIRGQYAYARHVHSAEGLTYPLPPPTLRASDTDAVQFLSETLRANPGAVTVIALGPLTNLARLNRDQPTVLPLAKRLLVMGGAVDTPGNITPHAEFNFYSDPTAARLVMESGIPITLIDMAPCRQVFLTRADVESARPAAAAGILAERLLAGWFRQGATRERFNMYDPLTLVAAIAPHTIKLRSVTMTVDDSTTTDDSSRWGRCRALDENDGPVRVAEPGGVDVQTSLRVIRALLGWSQPAAN
jgi:inosine-uridine nucleoside N-ribohydrolase